MTESAMFWVTLAIALVTCAATVINYFLFRAQLDPHVIVYAELDQKRSTIFLLVIENIGKGVAHDVSFGFSEPVPAKAFGMEALSEKPQVMSYGPLVDGIPALAPGARRVITWGQFGGLRAQLGDRTISVRCRYKSAARDPLQPKWYATESTLEVQSFSGNELPASDPLPKLVEHLKTIAEYCGHLRRTT